MGIENLFDRDDHFDHLESPDHWFSVSSQSTREAYRARVTSWILRILLGHGGMPAYCTHGVPQYKSMADLLEIPELATVNGTADVIAERLHERAQQYLAPLALYAVGDRQANWPVEACCMSTTLEWLSETAGLSPVERAILEFAVSLRVFQALKIAASTWGDINRGDLPHAMSAVLNIPLNEVRAVLSRKATLFTSGILRMYPVGKEQLKSMLWIPRQFAEDIAHHQGPPSEILEQMAVLLKPAQLGMSDFAHIPHHNDLASSWLQGVLVATARGQSAGHMLVTGEPGLGKTEWSRALLHAGGVQALEMVVTNNVGEALSGEDRLQNLRMIMHLQRATSRGVILFDEADDVFRSTGIDRGLGRGAAGDADAVSMENHRAALNQLLEGSRIPVIWIMNRPEVLDKAVLRRFDVEIHFEDIPRSVRLGLIHKRIAALKTSGSENLKALGDAEFERWAQIRKFTPALIDRLGLVYARSIEAATPMDATLCRHWLKQRIPGRPTQHLRVPMESKDYLSDGGWKPELVHASVDLQELVKGIQRAGSARLALIGRPGTGKTAFANALARMLDKPLLEKRASDLLSAYVGETEQHIRDAFGQALEDDAVLFIDEVDGLLANREMAVRNWEVTQVNELLEQLGEYPGVVVVATNRMDAIDPAALRRLDLKIEFYALKPEQVRAAFAELCRSIQLQCSDADLMRVARLSDVSPGDFACLERRLRFAPKPAAAGGLMGMLEEELARKAPSRKPMGFVTQQTGTGGD